MGGSGIAQPRVRCRSSEDDVKTIALLRWAEFETPIDSDPILILTQYRPLKIMEKTVNIYIYYLHT